jgi:hypothetical protein
MSSAVYVWCIKFTKKKKCTGYSILVSNMKGQHHFEDLNLNGKMTLELIEKQKGREAVEYIHLVWNRV